jgi:Predicted nucleotide-binding protein containing TIR-like domain
MDSRKVFVIHGRNDAARRAMFDFLRSIGLQPLEWSQLIRETRKASPYVGEVLDKGFEVAQAAIALMTPDDMARLRMSLQGSNEPSHETELTGQPRQNVLLETGMALGQYSDRTVIVEFGHLRAMSDTLGRHVIRINNSVGKRQDLAQRLETAGCTVDLTGRDWHTVGDFEGCIHQEEEQEPEAKSLEIGRAIDPSALYSAQPVTAVEALDEQQLQVLISIAEEIDHPGGGVTAQTVRNAMGKAGYNGMATNISLGSLMSMGMVEIAVDSDWNGNEYTVYRLRDAGIAWLSTNKDKLKLTTHYDDEDDDYTSAGGPPPNDDIPF